MGKPKGPGPGRPKGSLNKRTVEGQDYARDILAQDQSHLVLGADGTVTKDRHPRALVDPVFRRLREQARQGLGNKDGALPPPAFVSLADRAWGKVIDKVKLQTSTAKAFEGETDSELAARAAALATELGINVDPALLADTEKKEAN